MASIRYLVRGVRNPSPIYVVFTHTREFEVYVKLDIEIDPKNWDKRNQKIRNVITIKNRDEINLKLSELKPYIIDSFNDSYIQGEIIDRNLIDTFISSFFKRPAEESKFKIKEEEVYLTSFADWWLEFKAPTHKVKANKYMGERTISHYKILNNLIKEFEENKKIKLKEIDGNTLDNFSAYLSKKNYAKATIDRMINRTKFFCARAEENNLSVNKNYKQRVFVEEEKLEYKEPYLNIDEITKIFNLEIKDNDLDAIRDNFIIGLWTGLRISDLHRLSLDNINNKIIEIKTLKTGHSVAIPLHPQVIFTLNKRLGNLPSKTSDQHFNREIKKICKLAKIEKSILGGKRFQEIDETTGKKVYRKQTGYFPKYELVSSHICRRSFATNHFAKVPNNIIMDVCGWKSEKQMYDYNKQTNIESAKILAEFWKKETSN